LVVLYVVGQIPEAMCSRDFSSLPQDIFFLDVEGNCALAHLNLALERCVAPDFGCGVLFVIFMVQPYSTMFSSLSSCSTFLL
jgi:hypothetical protein